MKLTAYQKILTMAKEAKEALLAPIRAREMSKKAELEMCQIDSKILETEQSIADECAQYPVDFAKIISLIDKQALLERRKKQYKDILEQMFPADVD